MFTPFRYVHHNMNAILWRHKESDLKVIVSSRNNENRVYLGRFDSNYIAYHLPHVQYAFRFKSFK